jgi:hypothetical protein
MAKIVINGVIKNSLQKKGDKSVYYIYQFEVLKNDGYLEIIDVYSKEKLPHKDGDNITLPVIVSLVDNRIIFEVSTLDK